MSEIKNAAGDVEDPEAGGGLFDLPERFVLIGLIALAGVTFLAWLFVSPERTWLNLLLNSYYLLGLSLIGTFFVALQYLAHARWPTLLRRVPEAMGQCLPLVAGLMLLVCFGVGHLFHWSHADAVVNDAILSAKSGYLNTTSVVGRLVVFMILWIGVTGAIVGRSRTQDEDGRLEHTKSNVRLSAFFMVLFAATFSMSSIDWIMSLEPHWYSTLFPWYVFSSVFVAGLAVITGLAILLHRRGHLPGLNRHHLHDLGKYMLAFSFFWGYLWYSQYMLIWYSNIPEEITRFTLRENPGWNGLFLTNLIVNFIIPFFLLLPAAVKKVPSYLLGMCALIVVGHWLDLYLMVFPSHHAAGPKLGWLELITAVGCLAAFLLMFDRQFRSARPYPIRDPFLADSIHHHL